MTSHAVFFGVLGVGVVAAVAVLLVFAWPSGQTRPAPDRFAIAAVDVPAPGGAPILLADGGGWLVHLEVGAGTHRGVGAAGKGGLLALDVPESIVDCTVRWRPRMLFEGERGWFRDCPGSTFTLAGVRVFGPAPRSLDTFPVTVRPDGVVVVDMTRPIRGANDNPSRAVPYPAP